MLWKTIKEMQLLFIVVFCTVLSIWEKRNAGAPLKMSQTATVQLSNADK